MGLCYLCSDNKGAVQLFGNQAADLRLCFHICKKCSENKGADQLCLCFHILCKKQIFSLRGLDHKQ